MIHLKTYEEYEHPVEGLELMTFLNQYINDKYLDGGIAFIESGDSPFLDDQPLSRTKVESKLRWVGENS